ncbi:MAG: type III secretion system inner membrane ring subunit SctD [Ramlibacter sp.]
MSNADFDAVLDVMDEARGEAEHAMAPGADAVDTAPVVVPGMLDLADDSEPAGEPAAAPPAIPAPAVLQLRILSGMHAGARAPLNGDGYLLGALDDCDFVLDDAGVQPHHARLSRTDSGWQLDWVAQEGEDPVLAPMRLECGKAVPLGPVVVAVDEADAAWPTLEQLVLVPHAPALEPGLPEFANETLAPLGHWRTRLRIVPSPRGVVRVAAVSLGVLAVAVMMIWPLELGGPANAAVTQAAAVSQAAPKPVAPDPAQRRAIEAALASQGLTGRARIDPAGAVWMVRAPVLSELDGEALLAELAKLQPKPILRLPAEHELREEVTEALLRLAGPHAANVKLHAMGPGRFRLEGRIARTDERDKLLKAVADAFPQVTWDNALQTTEDTAAALLADLRNRGWQAAGEWKDGALALQVTLQQRDVPQWEQTLVSLAATHTVPLRASLVFAPAAAAPAPAPRADGRLPFQVRGVVGGDMPYVLLSEGDKLSQGGVWRGWRLASISASQVVFENGTQRAVLTR